MQAQVSDPDMERRPRRESPGFAKSMPAMSPEQAGRASIPFGRFRHQPFARVATTRDGPDYLRWLVGQKWFDGTPRRAAEAILAALAAPRQER